MILLPAVAKPRHHRLLIDSCVLGIGMSKLSEMDKGR